MKTPKCDKKFDDGILKIADVSGVFKTELDLKSPNYVWQSLNQTADSALHCNKTQTGDF